MTHADAFLQGILAHPDDDAPRLIFADWLEEQGDANSVARAEFIRIQCALATGKVPEKQRAELVRREQQILDEWDKEWVRPIRHLVHKWSFHRGFIDEATLFDATFLEHADQLFRCAPIQHLHLWPHRGLKLFSGSMAALADNENLRRLHSLDLREDRLESRDVRALIVSEHLTGLTSLNLSNNRIGDSGIRALATSPLLGRLIELDLSGNDLGPAGVRALARAILQLAHSSEGLRMWRLDLSLNNLGTAGQRVIADSPLLRRLVRS